MSTPSSAIDIVPADPSQAAAIATLHAAAFDHGWDTSAVARLLAAPAAHALIALEGYQHTPLGFVMAFLAADEAEILILAVDPRRRREGLGRRLVRALIERLEEADARRLFLEVGADNAAARGLYRALKFREVGMRAAYYHRPDGPAEDALILSLDLAPQEVPHEDDGRLRQGSL